MQPLGCKVRPATPHTIPQPTGVFHNTPAATKAHLDADRVHQAGNIADLQHVCEAQLKVSHSAVPHNQACFRVMYYKARWRRATPPQQR